MARPPNAPELPWTFSWLRVNAEHADGVAQAVGRELFQIGERKYAGAVPSVFSSEQIEQCRVRGDRQKPGAFSRTLSAPVLVPSQPWMVTLPGLGEGRLKAAPARRAGCGVLGVNDVRVVAEVHPLGGHGPDPLQ